MKHRNRSIHTPPRASQVSKGQRARWRAEAGEDGPTAFQLMRKAEQLGERVACDIASRKVYLTGSNSGSATASALTLLRFHDRITWPQFRAGTTYAWLRFSLFGPATPGAATLFRVIHEHISSDMAIADEETTEERADRIERMRVQYLRGDNRLRNLLYARRVREMVRRVCIDDYYPDPARPNHLARLREGLQELADTWRTE